MRLYVVGLGPGKRERMTQEAIAAIAESEVIVGYGVYVDLLGELAEGKKCMVTPMRGEVERCRMALSEAAAGRVTAVVSSGDGGIYGMAGLIYELSKDYEAVEICVVAGVTAASSGAALLGAPLMNDFAVISLSDLLTPWEQIERRLKCAAAADLVLCLYNPASKRRKDHLKRACDIVLSHKGFDTICGVARHIGRAGEEGVLLTLSELREIEVDMFSTVFIGNEATRIINGKMVTQRGYRYE